jgi:hypothetical protein
MARVEIEKAWLVRGPGTGLDAAVDHVVHEHGMSVTRRPNGYEMQGGSQVKMRLFGGLFTKDAILPRRGTIQRTVEPGESGVERIALHLEDRMGVGFMAPGMRKKCERILASVAFSIEAAVQENAADVRDALDPEAEWAGPAQVGTSASQGEPSTADELERLAQLHQRGLLSEQEFGAAKQKLLG